MEAMTDRSEICTSFDVEPLTDTCRSVFEERRHVVVGVSPANSYFNVGLLTELLGWLRAEFAQIDVVVPDSALEHTYGALGYAPDRAAKKAHVETSTLRNRVVRAWRELGGPREAERLHLMSELTANPAYRRTLARCEQALADDGRLRETCATMSRDVLTRGQAGQPSPERVTRAVRYLLAELPFFLDSAEIFEVESSVNFYHHRLPLADLLFSGNCVLTRSPRQAYAIIRRVSDLVPQCAPQDRQGDAV